MLKLKNRHRILKFSILLLCLGLFIVPQITQQMVYDQLPATGDLVHKRIVYLLTNFPDFYSEALYKDAAHSKIYHFETALFNIVTGLTGDKTFYGFGIVNLVYLVMSTFLAWSFGDRLSKQWGFLAPLLLLSTPLLVGPYTGQADIHLIYFFIPLLFFVVLFMKANARVMASLFIIMIGAVNSHFMIWLPLLLSVLVLEQRYPQFKILLLLPLSVLASWLLISPSLSYMSGLSPSLIAQVMVAGVLTILILELLFKKLQGEKQRNLRIGMGLLAILFFSIPQGTDPVYQILNPEQIKTTADQFSSPARLATFLFTINPAKGIPGAYLHAMLFCAVSALGIYKWKVERKQREDTESSKRLSTLFLLMWIPLGLLLLDFLLLTIKFELFALSPLGSFHSGRLNILAFFMMTFVATGLWPQVPKRGWQVGLLGLVVLLIISMSQISQFYFLRTVSGESQHSYQQNTQQVIEKGFKEVFLSTGDADYSCHFYGNCL